MIQNKTCSQVQNKARTPIQRIGPMIGLLRAPGSFPTSHCCGGQHTHAGSAVRNGVCLYNFSTIRYQVFFFSRFLSLIDRATGEGLLGEILNGAILLLSEPLPEIQFHSILISNFFILSLSLSVSPPFSIGDLLLRFQRLGSR